MFCFIPKFIYCCCFALYCYFDRFKLNIWDVGGQKSLRSYWRNYFESTDGLIWVVDCADKRRLGDCKNELNGLLLEEVSVVLVCWLFCSLLLLFVVCCCCCCCLLYYRIPVQECPPVLGLGKK